MDDQATTPIDPSHKIIPNATSQPQESENPARRLKRIGSWFRRLWGRIAPGPRAWRGASWGLLSGTCVVFLILACYAIAQPSPNYAGLIVIFLMIVAAFIVGMLAVLAIRLMHGLPRFYAWVLAASLFLLFLSLRIGAQYLVPYVVISCTLLGAGAWVLFKKGVRDTTLTQRCIAVAGLVLGTAAVFYAVFWLWIEGSASKTLPNAARKASAHIAPIQLPDPSQPGLFQVKTTTYGSGTDRRRPEYGEKVGLKTKPVNGSKLIGNWEGRAGWARTRYWGFDSKRLPIQGRVWYPDGAGPFPLVLCVHGNHSMEDFSDPGYGYLGQLLASRGYIFVSVDENFINSSLTDLIGIPDVGLKEENDARGWLLLEHLKVWRSWSRESGHPFQGKVDMNAIALIGHSRGGEAVAVAAVFNRLPYYPDNARVAFDYNFSIRSVIAIAPVDGQYKPAGIGTRPENVNYFVLHGSMDGDMESFHGSRVLERVRFTDSEYHFKATLYIHGANHGQFNTAWGRADTGSIYAGFLNLKPIIPAKDQERIAKVFISAYLDATLRAQKGFVPLFHDYRTGASWLPDCIYLQKFEDSSYHFISTYQEDIDLATTTMPGGKLAGVNLSDWKEKEINIKWGTLDTRAVYLGWNSAEFPGEASYAVTLPESGLELGKSTVLVFALADAKDKPSGKDKDEGGSDKNKKDKSKKDEGGKSKEPREPIDLSIEVADNAGAKARLPLSHYAFLQPQIESQIPKASFLSNTANSEIVFQTFEFPLADFIGVNPALDPARLKTIRFVFDKSKEGLVILDDIGFREQR